jgi:hypothetical protein
MAGTTLAAYGGSLGHDEKSGFILLRHTLNNATSAEMIVIAEAQLAPSLPQRGRVADAGL